MDLITILSRHVSRPDAKTVAEAHRRTCYTVRTVSLHALRYAGERGFSYCGPAAWNTLPSDLHYITDTGTFRKRLKSVLFDRAYH